MSQQNDLNGDVVNAIIESHSGWDGDQYEAFVLYDAKFREDFGPFKKGEVLKWITFSFKAGMLEEHNEDGVTIKRSCKLRLVAC